MARAIIEPEVEQIQREDISSVEFSIPAPMDVNGRYKRVFDMSLLIVAHLVLLPVLLLLWIAIPLAIWLEDRGPVFYAQRRVGRNGQMIRLYKFRSMVRDAESLTGPVWASEKDPRVTRVGRVLRSRALDELPQLINVFKGEMSLVGPRPERPEFVYRFSQDTPRFLRRLQVRPGLTGLAQIYGRYSSRPTDKLRYDMLYMRSMSPMVDTKLLLLSVWVSVRGRWHSKNKITRPNHRRGSPTETVSLVRAARSP